MAVYVSLYMNLAKLYGDRGQKNGYFGRLGIDCEGQIWKTFGMMEMLYIFFYLVLGYIHIQKYIF